MIMVMITITAFFDPLTVGESVHIHGEFRELNLNMTVGFKASTIRGPCPRWRCFAGRSKHLILKIFCYFFKLKW